MIDDMAIVTFFIHAFFTIYVYRAIMKFILYKTVLYKTIGWKENYGRKKNRL